MADRLDYYFRQKITEAELDRAFELLEKADRKRLFFVERASIRAGDNAEERCSRAAPASSTPSR